VHPQATKRTAPSGFTLGNLIFVVRKNEIHSTTVNVKMRVRYFALMAEHSMCIRVGLSPKGCPIPIRQVRWPSTAQSPEDHAWHRSDRRGHRSPSRRRRGVIVVRSRECPHREVHVVAVSVCATYAAPRSMSRLVSSIISVTWSLTRGSMSGSRHPTARSSSQLIEAIRRENSRGGSPPSAARRSICRRHRSRADE